MAYRVEIARSAAADLEELYLWGVVRAPHHGSEMVPAVGLLKDPILAPNGCIIR